MLYLSRMEIPVAICDGETAVACDITGAPVRAEATDMPVVGTEEDGVNLEKQYKRMCQYLITVYLNYVYVTTIWPHSL